VGEVIGQAIAAAPVILAGNIDTGAGVGIGADFAIRIAHECILLKRIYKPGINSSAILK